MHQFLIDECLSPLLAGVARENDCHAMHVNWLNRTGYRDQSHAVLAVAENFIFVTNNGADFRPIYRALDVHPGLVVILPVKRRVLQAELFRLVIARLKQERDLINKLIQIDEAGAITISEFPPFADNI